MCSGLSGVRTIEFEQVARVVQSLCVAACHELPADVLAALERAEALGGGAGPYTLQASIAACHARADTPEETNWARIAALYWALAQLSPSPIVELNRAVAVSRAVGPADGLVIVDALRDEPAMADYHLLYSVRGDLLARLERFDEAQAEFERAAGLTDNAREQSLLAARAAECASAAR